MLDFNTLTNAVSETLSEAVSDSTTVIAEASGTVNDISFTTENIGKALLCSAAGMVGIFIVIGIIILSVSILNKAGAEKKKKD